MKFCLLTVGLCLSTLTQAATVYLDGLVPGVGSMQKEVVSIKERKFLNIVRQQTDFSCGAASLATLLRYGYNIDTDEQRVMNGMFQVSDATAARKLGFSMLDIKNYVEQGLGMRVQGYNIPADKLSALPIPTIVLLDIKGYRHFVVLKRVDKSGNVYIADPALGNLTMSVEQFTQGWQGVVLAVVGQGYDQSSPLAMPSPPLTVRSLEDQFAPVTAFNLMDFGFNASELF
ncbi:C39 family peptidase [Vibrio brasiliensis]|jgi:predicted double-glycine peptidase|uniref:C39 family peptidase n=1 Tax=Vibrio brasiliensis LMG 20546 TaxID=945543 RepID=E8LXL9_9VIBR|nr:C39 family peptidase [Vibrio brasiliensis]EGA64630.1 C39 family peptidase [Vibrio brasiliensis LMG 20546]MCG9647813.1 C39 family peptidase [Vibrio brasiliensis]